MTYIIVLLARHDSSELRCHTTALIYIFQYAPFVFKRMVNDTPVYEGICHDLLKELARTLNFTYVFSKLTFARLSLKYVCVRLADNECSAAFAERILSTGIYWRNFIKMRLCPSVLHSVP